MKRALLVVGALLVAASAPARPAGSPQVVLNDLLEGHRPLADVEVRLRSGSDGPRGSSTLTISGDGALALEIESAVRTERRTSRLEEDGVRALLRLLSDTRFWTRGAPTGPLPRDAEVMSIRLATRQGDLDVEVLFPVTDAADSPDLLALVDLHRALEGAALEAP